VLRSLCPAVADTAALGDGFPGLVVKTASGRVVLCEVKDGKKPPSERRLTPAEEKVMQLWGDAYVIVSCVDDAIALSRT
jgi:hypothetical protein